MGQNRGQIPVFTYIGGRYCLMVWGERAGLLDIPVQQNNPAHLEEYKEKMCNDPCYSAE
jgi:hypothetical protein